MLAPKDHDQTAIAKVNTISSRIIYSVKVLTNTILLLLRIMKANKHFRTDSTKPMY